jgi:phosphohistidine phosphatase
MKILYALRHADAMDADAHMDDYHRKLSAQGLLECNQTAKALLEWHNHPEYVAVSSAVRTSQTALRLTSAGCFPIRAIAYEDGLYLATASELLFHINHLPEQHACVMLLGHNPGLYDLLLLLARNVPVTLMQQGLPTCGLVQLTFDVDRWHNILPASATVHNYTYPT